jgi:hypothetical protein
MSFSSNRLGFSLYETLVLKINNSIGMLSLAFGVCNLFFNTLGLYYMNPAKIEE